MNNTQQKLISDYKKLAPFYDTDKSPVWQEVRDLLSVVKPEQSVLDIGCGTGRISQVLPQNCNYFGVDISNDLINLAKKKYPNRKFDVQDALELNVVDSSYDAVLLIAVVHHFLNKEDRIKVLKKSYRALKPNGILYATVWNLNAPRYWKNWKGFRKVKMPNKHDPSIKRDYYAYALQGFKKELIEAGFKINKIYYAKSHQKDLSWRDGRNIVVVACK